jgi:hypothetical protein
MKYSLMGALAALAVGVSLAGAQQLPVTVQAEWGEGFGLLSNVRELPDGRVLVADPLGMLLAAIDLDSGTMETWGRKGGGPKEWRQPDAVHALPNGETLLVDLGNGRLVKIGADGTFGQTYPIARGGGGGGGGGSAGPGGRRTITAPTMLLPTTIDARGAIYFPARQFGSPNDSTVVTRTTLEDEASTALGKVKPQGMRRTGDGTNNVMVSPMPMTMQDDWGVGADGTVVFVRSDGYYLEVLRPDGSTVRGPAQNVELLRPSDEDKVAYLEAGAASGISMSISINNGERQISMARGGGVGGEPDITQSEWPRRMPAFRAGSTRVSPDGRIFVGRNVHAGEPALFDIFDLNGELIGHTEFGAAASIVGFGANGAIYVAETDMFGLQWLKKVTVG